MIRKPVVLIPGAGGEIGHGLIAHLASAGKQPVITLDVNPLEPAAPHLGDEAIERLKLACRYHHLPLPRRPWTVGDVISRLAQMGGYEPRKDRPPGWKVIWRGWRVFNNFWDHVRFVRHQTAPLARPKRAPKSAPSAAPVPVLQPARSATNPG